MPAIERVECYGPCGAVSCLQTGRHAHPICPECGALRFGNMNCGTCQLVSDDFKWREEAYAKARK